MLKYLLLYFINRIYFNFWEVKIKILPCKEYKYKVLFSVILQWLVMLIYKLFDILFIIINVIYSLLLFVYYHFLEIKFVIIIKLYNKIHI